MFQTFGLFCPGRPQGPIPKADTCNSGRPLASSRSVKMRRVDPSPVTLMETEMCISRPPFRPDVGWKSSGLRGNAGIANSLFWETMNPLHGYNLRYVFDFQNAPDLCCALMLLFGAAWQRIYSLLYLPRATSLIQMENTLYLLLPSHLSQHMTLLKM